MRVVRRKRAGRCRQQVQREHFTGADEQISITVEAPVNGQVKLVFDAPDSVGIWREELLEPE